MTTTETHPAEYAPPVPHDALGATLSYREHATAIRGINRNDGRTAATTHALARHHRALYKAEDNLIAAGESILVGLLVEEHALAERLSGLPRGFRPELRTRIRITRKAIYRGIARLEAAEARNKPIRVNL